MRKKDSLLTLDRQFPSLPLQCGGEEIDPDALLPFATLGASEGWLHGILSWACGQPDLTAAHYCYSLGRELTRARRRRAAWLALETALTVCCQQVPPAPGLAGEALDAMGKLLDDIVDSPGAIQYLERALTVWRTVRGETDPQVAEILNNLGYLHKRAGRLDEARDCYEQALAIWQETLGPQHAHIAAVLNNLGAVARAAGRPEEARRNYENALTISRAVHGPTDPTTGTILANLGAACQDAGDGNAAAGYLSLALSVLEQAGPAAAVELAAACNNLGHLLLRRGEWERARRLFMRALALYDEAGDSPPLEKACTLNNLGVLYQVTGDDQAAEEALGRAYTLRYHLLGPQHPQTMNTLYSLQHTQGCATLARPGPRSLLSVPLTPPN